jgi:hypothetical protein
MAELSKDEVIRRLREAGFTPDPEPEEKLPIIPEHAPPITQRPDEDEDGVPAAPGGLSFFTQQSQAIPGTRRRRRDPNGEPWMIWISQMWSEAEHGVPVTHIRFAASRDQHTYRTEGHWDVGITVPGYPGPDEFLYHCERELSDVVGHSCRITHFDGRAVGA